jgi:hypothetical protein
MRPEHPGYRDTLAQLGMRIDERGRYRVTPPEPPKAPPLPEPPGAVHAAITACAAALRDQLGDPKKCGDCKRAHRQGWRECSEHGLLGDLDFAARACTEDGRLWGWAWAIAYRNAPSLYVDESSRFGGEYAGAVCKAWGGP